MPELVNNTKNKFSELKSEGWFLTTYNCNVYIVGKHIIITEIGILLIQMLMTSDYEKDNSDKRINVDCCCRIVYSSDVRGLSAVITLRMSRIRRMTWVRTPGTKLR